MNSENCRIDEFVETVKNKTSWDALSLAVEEANWADHMAYRADRKTDFQTYSRQLKRLIGYLRYSVTPRRPQDKAYRLYMQHWGSGKKVESDDSDSDVGRIRTRVEAMLEIAKPNA